MKGNIVIERVEPEIDGGRYPAKRILGDIVTVSADIYSHGTGKINARVKHKSKGERVWHYSPMTFYKNDEWRGEIPADELGELQFQVEAWIDDYGSWVSDLLAWRKAGEDVTEDIKAGIKLLSRIMMPAKGSDRRIIKRAIDNAKKGRPDIATGILTTRKLTEAAARCQKKTDLARSRQILKVQVERRRAGFSSWYEIFPRSQGKVSGRSGTFSDVINRLDEIKAMGFDVLYLTPIHPIGTTNRRGKDGSMKVKKTDPGSPWAIGNEEGGHKAINSDLGNLDDFRKLVKEAAERKMEIALDIAYQCSPDHPYVKQHPEWFYHRPDGTIRYAENPPKKYFDIYPLNFETEAREELYEELKSIITFWADTGVRIFRIDNPHTKPFGFWDWMIAEVRKEFPDTIFLSEAFTKPKVMYHLSKLGFTQSYTYFTWRNYDWEISEYFKELSTKPVSDHFRPMLFTNTPDILPFILQRGGRAAFKLRAILAATLSSLWGIYSGFELCENDGIPGKEEYHNSEKYEIKVRNWNLKGNIKPLITKLNEIRKMEGALQENGNVEFHEVNNPNLLFYSRRSSQTGKTLLVAVNINPYEAHHGTVKVPLERVGICTGDPYMVRDKLTGDIFQWQGEYNYVRLIPDDRPAHILEVLE